MASLAIQAEPEAFEQEEVEEHQAEARDFDAEARAQGWRPEAEWPDGKPKPAKFRTAEEFLRIADESVGLKTKENDHLKKELAELKRMVRKLTASEQQAHNDKIAAIKGRMEAAVESGDIEAFRKEDAKLDKVRQEVEADVTAGEDPNEQFDTFRENNAWYDRGGLAGASEVEIDARAHADRLADRYARQGLQQTMAPSEFFAKVADETAAKFPLLKAARTREKPGSPVAGVSRPSPGSASAKTGVNLPADAKEHAERYMRMGLSREYKACKTKQDAWNVFARDYTWS